MSSSIRNVCYVLLYIFVIISGRSLSAKILYTHQQFNQILNQQKVSSELQILSGLKSQNLRLLKINDWRKDPTTEPLVKDKLLYEATLLFRDLEDDSLSIQAMKNLLDYQSEAFLPLSDAGHIIEVAAFQVAASAKATLLHWEINRYFKIAREQLSNNPQQFVDSLSQLNDGGIPNRGYIKAIIKANTAQISPVTNIIKLEQTLLPTNILLTLAKTTVDEKLYQLLIEQYHPNKIVQAQVIASLSNLPESFSAEDKVRLLSQAITKDDLASTAMIAIAPYTDSFIHVQDLLFASLSDEKTGGAAAKALSTSKDLLTLKKLALNLKKDVGLRTRHSLLALYLNNSYQAKKILLDFKDSTTNLQLKREVGQWLR